ncbi:molybdopterin converting factor subunit 1 [Andreprevotia chitinilytica]|uniref:molybdopterin converting factor subunit 1 n=1 Tax=Andreprevotia chitinilytica TaxID=396808 RepID=UPI000554C18A|nr:molybdopterin converting factor subunit 1 [Andreprevotia chitinilytica]
MTIQLLFFARLRETFGRTAEELPLPDGCVTVADLLEVLRARGGDWAAELAVGKSFRIAVDQMLADADARLAEGSEVAIFPPVTGG